jgi:hypothetical protein
LTDYFPAVKIPPTPFTKGGDILAFTKGGDILAFTKGGDILAFTKGGDIWGFLWPIVKSPRPPLVKGEIFWPFGKGEIFRGYFRIVCRKGSYAGKDRMPASFRK